MSQRVTACQFPHNGAGGCARGGARTKVHPHPTLGAPPHDHLSSGPMTAQRSRVERAAADVSGGPTIAETPPGQTERLIRAAHMILDGVGLEMHPGKLSRVVRRYQHTVKHNGWAFFDWIATSILLSAEDRHRALMNPDVARAIAYADPTGETAVRNVMREARP